MQAKKRRAYFRHTLLCAGLALGIYGAEIAGVISTRPLRIAIVDWANPLIVVVNWPLEIFHNISAMIGGHLAVYEENTQLREENQRLREWRMAALQLQRQNEQLRALTGLEDKVDFTGVSARVIADSGRPFVYTVIINAGAKRKISPHAAVIDANGLVGQVIEIGQSVSRVLLVNDLNSRVPVVVARTGQKAIMAGRNTPKPALLFANPEGEVKTGDRIITSGHGGVFQSDLPVGEAEVFSDGAILVRLYADLERLDYVRLVKPSGNFQDFAQNAFR